ncbi:hypothetical protein DB88DRAFT_85997 [Papiliotrema laurentii]|uniref:Cupin type-1 domain-containing protein n=1 Tax=Papiliotrema laurentii TaxID=5418 RepID=A0AAD9FN80_PAPLA|nr:hypothetical protein DB88DRAFT_85997 [Papiliotrema laurentii]
MASPRPLSKLKVAKHLVPPYGGFPNSGPTGKPLFVYPSAFPSSTAAAQIESHLKGIGVVKPAWRYTMYREHHFHSTTHEVLVVHSGSATLCFGGRENPGRVVHEAEKGDVLIIPAGMAHALLEDHGGFGMVGSYPVGAKQWDHCTGGERGVEDRIKRLEWFTRDPIYGDDGPVLG